MIGLTGRAGARIDAIGFITGELAGVADISMEKTYGYWEPLMTHVAVETAITISAESSKGQDLTESQSTSFGTSINTEISSTVTSPVAEASTSVAFEFSTDTSFGSEKTSSNSVTHGAEI